jgi:hypothetical protein
MRLKYLIILLLCCAGWLRTQAQDDKKQLMNRSLLDTSHPVKIAPPAVAAKDTTVKKDTAIKKKDTAVVVKKKKHDPHKATIRSAILPGWGQAYNREYWKIPIVYGALAIPAATFIYNNTWYKRTKKAYSIAVSGQTNRYNEIDPVLLKFVDVPETLQNFRNQFRRDRDYSVLWFFILWGINVVDATVFGHLKDFDVSDDLSMRVTPTLNNNLFSPTPAPGLSFVFNFRNSTPKPRHTDNWK